jgi:3-phenylpropionate/trans-cinnamate dioxygenase ferredoxin reductase subunit
MSDQQFVIVGAGLAGAKTAEALRDNGHSGPIVLIGDEVERPYERPPLSKEYLTGKSERNSIYVHAPDWYTEHRVDLRLGRSATSIDPAAHLVRLDDGSEVGYAKLLLATGSRVRALPIPGADAGGVLSLRGVSESDRIREVLGAAGRLIVIGAGWIGLEVSAAARAAGVEVTVVEAAELPLLRVLGPEIARSFADLHTAHGVDFRFGATLTEIRTGSGAATGVSLADGTVINGDAVLVAAGIRPNTELAEAAGLSVQNGITVDAGLRTSDPDIYAAGDVASAWHPSLKRQLRVEHWANALNQPAVAAAGMLGQESVYDRLPYFYTDQYDLGMEYVGWVDPDGYDEVVIRGDLPNREYIAFWMSAGRVLAGMNVNVWDVVEPIRALITSGQQIATARLADQNVPLTEII